jgi:hypothetical protein
MYFSILRKEKKFDLWLSFAAFLRCSCCNIFFNVHLLEDEDDDENDDGGSTVLLLPRLVLERVTISSPTKSGRRLSQSISPTKQNGRRVSRQSIEPRVVRCSSGPSRRRSSMAPTSSTITSNVATTNARLSRQGDFLIELA